MTIENHTLRESLTADIDIEQILYSNGRVGGLVNNLADALNYIFATIYPQFIGSFPTFSDLPITANPNEYAYVINDGDGKSAGYVWIELDGTAQWEKRYDVSWSLDNVLADLVSQTKPLYVFSNGRTSGQTIYGGNAINENLTLNANSFDDSGEIIITNDLVSANDNTDNLGKLNKRFKDLYLAGLLKDGTFSISIAHVVDAYNHVFLTNNPHSVAYDQLITKIGLITLEGDTTGSLDLSSSGDKTLTIDVIDDSHDHTKTTLPDFDNDVYAKVKAIIQDNDVITYTKDDTSQTIKPTWADVSTERITDIDAPVTDRILGSSDGVNWSPKKVTVELTGDVEGSADWDSSTQKTAINTTVKHILLDNVERIELKNITVSVAVGNPAVVTCNSHKLNTGDKVHLSTLVTNAVVPSIDSELTVTVLTANTFTIPVNVTTAGNGYIIPNSAQFLYDSSTKNFIIKRPWEEINHSELSRIDVNDDHLQYARINGRNSGQTIHGGTSANEDLILDSTVDATKGQVRLKSNLAPFANSTYSGGWSGVDLGLSSKTFRNLYMSGEAFGLRVENVTTLPASSGTSRARLLYHSAQDKFYYDNGTSIKPLSNTNLPISIDTYTNVTSKTIDLASVLDTGKTTADYNWTLWNDATSEMIHASITRSNSTQVLITTELPLSGSYKLKGI